jgi:hypothetical protein
MRTLDTIREQDVASALNHGGIRARFRPDAVGIGHYHIDIHPCRGEDPLPPLITSTRPFQIPLGVLIPLAPRNLLAAGKTAGTTRLGNACTRLHPIEWAMGEAAGELAAYCMDHDLTPHAVHADSALVRGLQDRLVAGGVPIFWYDNVSPDSRFFTSAQLAPFDSDSLRERFANRWHYRP